MSNWIDGCQVEDQMRLLESCWSELLLLELVYNQLDYLSESNHLIMVSFKTM